MKQHGHCYFLKSTPFLLAVLFAGCSAATDTHPGSPASASPLPTVTPLQQLELKRDSELETKFAEIARDAKGKVGVAAILIETGDAAFFDEHGRYPMQSVYKLPIAMAVMEQARLGKLNLDTKIPVTKDDFVRRGQASPLRDKNPNGGEFTIRELIRLSLVESDGTASDVLMRLAGGPVAVQDHLSQIGIQDMKVVNTEKEFASDWNTQYKNWATPAASVELLRWLFTSYRAESPAENVQPGEMTGSSLLIKNMFESVTGPGRIKGLMTKGGGNVAHKTGTSGTRNGITAATNDIGIITLDNGNHIAIAVYVADSPADEKTREGVIARISKAAWDTWTSE
jgi:beta-lactamase class A